MLSRQLLALPQCAPASIHHYLIRCGPHFSATIAPLRAVGTVIFLSLLAVAVSFTKLNEAIGANLRLVILDLVTKSVRFLAPFLSYLLISVELYYVDSIASCREYSLLFAVMASLVIGLLVGPGVPLNSQRLTR